MSSAGNTVLKTAAVSAAAALAGFLLTGSLLAQPEGSLDLATAVAGLPGWVAAGGVSRASALAPLAGVLCACAVWGLWAHQRFRGGTFRRGEEHGSARWGTLDEGRAFMNREDPSMNIPLTKNIGIPVERPRFDLETDRNRNVCVVGTPGTGKTRSHVLPLLMQMNASYLVTDPKGTLVGSTGWMFEEAGYRIRSFDLVRMDASSRYNPLAYVISDVDVLSIVECLIANTKGDAEHTGDPFWENAERLLYTALIAYLVHHCPPEDRTLPGMLTLLSLAEAREGDESYLSPLDLLFLELETGKRLVAEEGGEPFDEGSRSFSNGCPQIRWAQVREPADQAADFALNAYKRFKTAAGETLKSIIISCNTRCLPMMADNVQEILSADELELDHMGDAGQRTVVFASMPDTRGTFNFLFAMLMWQAVNELCDAAIIRHGGRLPTPVHLVFDEFANIGKLPDIDRFVAVIRSRNVSMSMILQSFEQLKATYGEEKALSIRACCDTTLFLGSTLYGTNEEVSKMLGNQTVASLTVNDTDGQSRSTTVNRAISERPLMLPDEVGRLSRRKALLLIAGAYPFRDDKCDAAEHPRWDEVEPGHAGARHARPFDFKAHAERLRKEGKKEEEEERTAAMR